LPVLPLQPDPDGVQAATLTAAALGARLAYEGSIPGPVLRLAEGQRVRLGFRNATDTHTSLHLHGLPIGPDTDRPLTHLLPGEQDQRDVTLPPGSAGTYWYHPHAHGDVERQLLAGLAGAVVVSGPVDDHPALAEADDQLVMITRDAGELVVNGAPHPLLTATATRVRLRAAQRHRRRRAAPRRARQRQRAPIPAADRQRRRAARPARTGPGRAAAPGRPRRDRRGRHPDSRPERRGRLRRPAAAADRAPLQRQRRRQRRQPEPHAAQHRPARRAAAPTTAPAAGRRPDLDPDTAVRTRQIVLDADAPAASPSTAGPFDPDRTDLTAQLDTLEIWEIANAHTVDHPFHLHSYRVQLLDTDGRPPRTGPGSTPSTSAADRPSAWPSPSPASPAAPSTTATSPTTRTSA
jgi:FtsP/CotA-like multicopper oxidase with cupredoxin domain